MHAATAAEVLGDLLERSHRLWPEQVAPAAAEAGTRLGAHEFTVYLVDLEQRALRPAPGHEGAGTLDIDGTLAGRAFRQVETVLGQAEDGRVRAWVPLLDGAERLGVVGLEVDAEDAGAMAACRSLVSLVGQLVVTKSVYGDALKLARRSRPLDLAAELRWTFMPPLSFTNPRVSLAGILEPAYEIAGDAFDYALNGDILHVAVFDAMGHGLEASRLANLAVGAYRHARRLGLALRESLLSMDDIVAGQFGRERFVTGQLATLGLSTGRLEWLNAGHPRPLILRQGSVVGELAGTTGLPIGLGDIPTETAVQSMEPGDTVVFFSDGVTDARSPDGELFGEHRLADHLGRAASSAEPLAEMVRRLAHAVLAHEGADLRDDATVLTVQWLGPQGS